MNLVRIITFVIIVAPQSLFAQTDISSGQLCNLSDSSIIRFRASNGEAILFRSHMSDAGDGNLLVQRELIFSDGREVQLPEGRFFKADLVYEVSCYDYMAFSKELIIRSFENPSNMQELSPKLLDALQDHPNCADDQDDEMCVLINKGYIKPRMLNPEIVERLVRENAPVISVMTSPITSTSVAYDAASQSAIVLYSYSD